MVVQCERCKQDRDCLFAGKPADVDCEKAQNGMWLCRECLPLMNEELGDAIARFRKIMDSDPEDFDVV